MEFFHNVFHLRGAEELRFFDVDDIARFRHCGHQIGLPRKKGGKLDDIAHFGDGLALMGFVYVGNDGDAELCFDFFKNL
ncbi:Uncharacterised protein [Neisseria meningitidis]|nr:Uncharacterised protein [Neisseria meningitidis]